MRLPQVLALVFAALVATALGGNATAAEAPIVLGEVAVPPAGSGVDRGTLLTAAAGELAIVDTSRLHKRRQLIVSIALSRAAHTPFACTVNALVRDAKTGTLLAILEGRARADGVADPELRKRVLRAAVHSAVLQIPAAVAVD